MFGKKYSFLQVLGGTALFFVLVSYLLVVTTGETYGQAGVISFSIVGMVIGFAGGFLILNAYYKLTGKLGLEKYQIEKEIVEVDVSGESEIASKKIKDVSFPPLATVAIIERDGDLIPPRGDTEIKEDDLVILAGRPDVVTDMARVFEATE